MSKGLALRESALIQSQYVEMTLTGARFKKGMPAEEWVASMKTLGKVNDVIQLAIGDGLNYAEKEYGEEAWQYIEQAEVGETAVRNWKWVAEAVPDANRIPGLDFAHYRAVAKLEDKNEQKEILKQAKAEKWSTRDLEAHVRQSERVKATRRSRKATAEGEQYQIYKGMLPGAGEQIPDNSIDMILTDPERPAEALELYEALGTFAARALKPSGVLVVYCSQEIIGDAVRLTSAFITFVWVLSVEATKAQKIGARNISSSWRPALLFCKGEKPPAITPDSFSVQEGEGAQSMTRQLLDAFTLEGELVLDPEAREGEILLESLRAGRKAVAFTKTAEGVKLLQVAVAALEDEQAEETASAKKKEKPKGEKREAKPKGEAKPSTAIPKPGAGGPGGKGKGGKKGGKKSSRRGADADEAPQEEGYEPAASEGREE